MEQKGTFPRHDPGALREEAAHLLRDYLRIDTTNPPGNEIVAARHFQRILKREGVEAQVLSSSPGRGNLVARLPGADRDRGPIVLLPHADVVPARPDGWSAAPFGGHIRDGFLVGRGALDMKSVGILHLMAFLEAARSRIPLPRDLLFVLVADEETGGRLGTEWLLDRVPGLGNASLVLDEGGFIEPRLPEAGGDLYCVSVAEKIPVHLELEAHGEAGHGSIPVAGSSTERIVTALHRILALPRPPRLHPVVRTFFQRLAAATPGPGSERLSRIEESLRDPEARQEILRDPLFRAVLQDTVTCTMLRAGDKINVIPSMATAGIDCRILPDGSPEAFLAEVARCVEDLDVRLRPTLPESGSGVSPLTGPFWEALEGCVREEGSPGTVLPILMPGAADGRFFRRRGIPVYGFAPFRIPREERARMHGVDERLSLDNLSFGVGFFVRLLHRLVAGEASQEERTHGN